VAGEQDDRRYTATVAGEAQGPLLVHQGMNEPGVWKLTTDGRKTAWYVVQSDPRETDLTPYNDEDREKVGKLVSFVYQNDADELVRGLTREDQPQYFWWWFLLGVIALLCGEVWMTRRIVKGRG
jgi:hypothetical protein